MTTGLRTPGEGQSTALGVACRFCGRNIISDHNLSDYNLEAHEEACVARSSRVTMGRRRRGHPEPGAGQLDLFDDEEGE